jgi:hypothetical protein
MTTPSLPMEDLAQQIARQESELERLRREFEARRAHLDELGRRKQELEAQLHQVEAEIRDIARGGQKAPAARAAAAPARAPARGRRGRGPKITDLIVDLVRQGGGRAVTVKSLAQEVIRRKFPTTSGNIPRLVQTRVGELVRKGVLRRARGRPGVVPGEVGDGAAAPRRARGPARGKRKKAPGRSRGQPPLREVLMDILKKSRQPLGSGELAKKVLATGYQTGSKDFAGVVSVALTKIPNLENVPGRGYRLKKGRG